MGFGLATLGGSISLEDLMGMLMLKYRPEASTETCFVSLSGLGALGKPGRCGDGLDFATDR